MYAENTFRFTRVVPGLHHQNTGCRVWTFLTGQVYLYHPDGAIFIMLRSELIRLTFLSELSPGMPSSSSRVFG